MSQVKQMWVGEAALKWPTNTLRDTRSRITVRQARRSSPLTKKIGDSFFQLLTLDRWSADTDPTLVSRFVVETSFWVISLWMISF